MATMNRRAFCQLPAFALAAQAPKRRPNILVIVADDLGYADVGFNGARDIPTPHLDALAKAGVHCPQGSVSHPFCSPTRAGLLTGRYQQRFGHENNPKYDPNDERAGLPLSEVTLPQTLAAAGYQTGIVGKWHLGAAREFHPLKRGFREQFGFIGGGHDYFQAQMELPAREYLVPIERNGQPVALKSQYLTDALSDAAADFIRRHSADPFFLYLAYNSPHTPQQVIDKYESRFRHIASDKRRKHAAMVAAVDDGVGQVLATLKEQKLDEHTLVFFISDNGGPTQVTEADNRPLRGVKGQVYEGGVRVPFVARWTGRIPAGARYEHPVSSLDLFPTACAAAGVAAPKQKPLDGVNLLPFLTGQRKTAAHQRLFWRTGGGVAYGVREGNWKLVVLPGGKKELYDLGSDVGEANDLAAAQPEVVARLDQARLAWDRQLIPPLFESPQPANQKKKA